MGFRLTQDSRQGSGMDGGFTRPRRPSDPLGKRLLDVVVASIALFFLSPLIAIVAIAIWVQDSGNPIFAQKRYGRDGETFRCFKLRSMVMNAQERLDALLASDADARQEWNQTQKLKEDPRITPLGQFIRKTSIDELPQLWNVIRGDMSLVGPRPIVENEVKKYGEDFGSYCSVRPGVTGLWQVRGRSTTTYAERVAMDVEYAETRSFLGDVKILFLTIPAVLSSKGAM